MTPCSRARAQARAARSGPSHSTPSRSPRPRTSRMPGASARRRRRYSRARAPVSADALHELLLLDHGQRGERRGAAGGMPQEGLRVERLAARGGPGVHHLGAAQAGRDRHARGEALGDAQEIGNDAFVLAGEPAPGATEAGVDLVSDQQPALLVAHGAQLGEEAVGGDALAAAALDGLHQHGAHRRVAAARGAARAARVAEARKDRGARQPRREGLAEERAPGGVEGAEGEPVIGALEGHHTRAGGGERARS